MTDSVTTEGNGTSRYPTHIAFQIRDRDGKKGFWTRIGAAYAHADGQGFTIHLECIPLDGRVVLRVAAEQ